MTTEDERAQAEKLTFQYWSGPMCIWAFVGQSKLDRILQEWMGLGGDAEQARTR